MVKVEPLGFETGEVRMREVGREKKGGEKRSERRKRDGILIKDTPKSLH